MRLLFADPPILWRTSSEFRFESPEPELLFDGKIDDKYHLTRYPQ